MKPNCDLSASSLFVLLTGNGQLGAERGRGPMEIERGIRALSSFEDM